jgi:hypothetical protein
VPVIQFWGRKFAVLFLFVLITACGGGGDGSAPSTPPFGTGASKLFVGDAGQQAIGSSSNSNPPPGTAAIQRVVSGPNTMLDSALIDFALDAGRDRLYVADLRSILAFDNISTISGNVAPRVISSFGPSGNFVGIDLDRTNDRLYAAVNLGLSSHEVRVFDSVSIMNNVAASRTFTFATNFLIDVAIDPINNVLYVYNLDVNSRTQISVFDNAASLSTNGVTPTRTITIGDSFSSGVAAGMFVDAANDRLYAPRGNGTVMVFDTASSKFGLVTAVTGAPSRTINLPVPACTNITVDLNANRLYAVDNAGLNIVDNASTVNGTPPTVTRALASSGSSFMAVAVKP